MKLPVAPAQYDKRDQDLTRWAIERNDYEVVHFGRDIPLARGEKLILYSADGSQFAVTVDDNGQITTDGNHLPIVVNLNDDDTPAQPTITGAALTLFGEDGVGGSPGVYFLGYGAGPSFTAYRAQGTGASPSALTADQTILAFNAGGFGATDWAANKAQLAFASTENWTDSANGSRITLATTPNGSTTRTERLRVDQNGALVHRNNATIVVDADSHLGLRSYTVGTLPSAAVAARLIYVSDGTANKRLAVSDGTNWRWPDGAVVS